MNKLVVQVRVNEGGMRDANPHVLYWPEQIVADVTGPRKVQRPAMNGKPQIGANQ